MNGFCKLLDQIYQKLKAIDIYLLELYPEYPFFSSHKFLVDPLHFLPSQTSNISEIVNIVIVSSWREKLKWNFIQ